MGCHVGIRVRGDRRQNDGRRRKKDGLEVCHCAELVI